MSMRGAGTHLISWAQTRIDGEAPNSDAALTEGASWRWFGVPLRLDGPQGAMLLGNGIGLDTVQRRARAVVRKLVRTHGMAMSDAAVDDDPLYNDGFIVTDGVRFYPLVTVEGADPAGPLVLFAGDVPPVNKSLTIVKVAEKRKARPTDGNAVICFTPGTLLATPGGSMAVEDMYPGDVVLTKDNGPQEVLWMGLRHVSGGRLRAMGHVRPVRIRAGALGGAQPQPDLIVSPEHRVLLQGRKAQALFNQPEVLVRAADLVDDYKVIRDHKLREVTYIHLMFERHEVIFANGVETESFHPGLADLSHLNEVEREDLEEIIPDAMTRPDLYGPYARRCLSEAEAAILRCDGTPHYLT